jgi:hypothetical protein
MAALTRNDIEIMISLSPWILFVLLIIWGEISELRHKRRND